MLNTIDGAPDAVKIACPVLVGGKAGDYIKGLPIETSRIIIFASDISLRVDGMYTREPELPYSLKTAE